MTPDQLEKIIEQALQEPCPAKCNEMITLAHRQLSQALARTLNAEGVANFHSWAVWGSKKAGVTIRQEDLESALADATRVAGLCGTAVGFVASRFLGSPLPWWKSRVGTVSGMALGATVGSWSGRAIARWSRRRASELVLEGNKLVLDDIGRRTVAFCRLREKGESQTEFQEGDLLDEAFFHYNLAVNSKDLESKHQTTYYANCLAILHEHLKLQPYIKGSMPFIVRRCVTKRMLEFEIGPLKLLVSEDVPSLDGKSYPLTLREPKLPNLERFLQRWQRAEGSAAAGDWTKLEDRMAYIVELFRHYHLDRSVHEAP